MTSAGARVAFIACGAVAIDTKTLVDRHGWKADVHGISSDLHMTPLEIGPAVEAKLLDLLPRYDRVIVVYGDCRHRWPLRRGAARSTPAVRPAGFHCFQWYAGELYYVSRIDIGHFFLTDWLVTNWDRAVIKGSASTVSPSPRTSYFGNISRILFGAPASGP